MVLNSSIWVRAMGESFGFPSRLREQDCQTTYGKCHVHRLIRHSGCLFKLSLILGKP